MCLNRTHLVHTVVESCLGGATSREDAVEEDCIQHVEFYVHWRCSDQNHVLNILGTYLTRIGSGYLRELTRIRGKILYDNGIMMEGNVSFFGGHNALTRILFETVL